MIAFSLLTLLLLVLAYTARSEGRMTPLWRLVIAIAVFIVGALWIWFGITTLL